MPHVVVLPDLALEVVVDPLPLLGVPPEEVRGQHEGLGQGRPRPDPVRDVLPAEPVVRPDHHRVLREREPAAGRVAEVVDGFLAVALEAQVLGLERELVDVDGVDPTHGVLTSRRAGSRDAVT